MQSQARALGLPIIRSSAVAGSALTDKDMSSCYDSLNNKKYYHRSLTKGEVGCYLSHRLVWEKIAYQNINVALVLEDDVVIDKNIHKVLALAQTLKHWDIIKLSDNRNNAVVETKELQNGFKLVNYSKIPSCANGYLISKQGASKLLARQRVYRPVDVDFQFHTELNLKIVGIIPYVISEQILQSDIVLQNGGTHSFNSSFLRNLRYRLRIFLERRKISTDLSNIIDS